MNESPTDVSLSGSAVAENSSSGTAVGTLSNTDVDSGNTYTYTLVSGNGDTDNASFTISGTSLVTAASFNYEAKSSYSIRVNVNDGLNDYEKQFTITVTDVNESPVNPPIPAVNYKPKTSEGTLITDEDKSANGNLSGFDFEGDALTYRVVTQGIKGTVTITDSSIGAYSYVPNPDANGNDSFTFVVNDGNSDSNTSSVTLQITAINDAPRIEDKSFTIPGGVIATYSLDGSDVDQDTLTYRLVEQPTKGTVVIDGSKFKYTPFLGANVEDHFAVIANDGKEDSKPAIIKLILPLSSGVFANGTPIMVCPSNHKIFINLCMLPATNLIGNQNEFIFRFAATYIQQLLIDRSQLSIVTPIVNMVIPPVNFQVNNIQNMFGILLNSILSGSNEPLPVVSSLKNRNVVHIAQQSENSISIEDISYEIIIRLSHREQVDNVNEAVKNANVEQLIDPIDFEASAIYGDKTIALSNFSSYVKRELMVPNTKLKNPITTAVVVESNGTLRQVPTFISNDDLTKSKAVFSSLSNSTYTLIYNQKQFADVEKHWSKLAVNNLGSRLIINGKTKTEFAPNDLITRAEFAAILIRAIGLKHVEATLALKDVKSSDWYFADVQTAVSNGLIFGYEDGTFKGDQTIRREEAALMLSRALKWTELSNVTTATAIDQAVKAFPDATSISVWSKQAVASIATNGMIKGDEKGWLHPKLSITRAETATMIERLLKKAELIN